MRALFPEAVRLFCCSKCKLIYDEGQTFEFGLMKITLTVFLKSDFVLLLARGDAALRIYMCKSVRRLMRW
jgi:hypothetical protein